MTDRPVNRAQLVAELAQFREIAFPTPPEGHPYELDLLDSAKDAVVRGRVLIDCALMEELSGVVLMHYWLATDRAFMRLRYFGRNKKYRSLFDALGRVSARQKMAALKNAVRVPKAVTSNVERMLAIRDVLAHRRTFEAEHVSIMYKGASVFSATGLERFVRDATVTIRWFARKARLMDEQGKRRATRNRKPRGRHRAAVEFDRVVR
jgi:hypothetical protein